MYLHLPTLTGGFKKNIWWNIAGVKRVLEKYYRGFLYEYESIYIYLFMTASLSYNIYLLTKNRINWIILKQKNMSFTFMNWETIFFEDSFLTRNHTWPCLNNKYVEVESGGRLESKHCRFIKKNIKNGKWGALQH